MPGNPADGPDQSVAFGTGAMTMHAVSFVMPSHDAQYGVTTFDFPTLPMDIAPQSKLYVVVRDRIVAELGGHLVSDVHSSLYSLPGEELELEQSGFDGGPPARISGRYFSTGKRIYFVSLLRRNGAASDEAVHRFFESFRLTR